MGKNYCGGVGRVVDKCRDKFLDMGHEVYVLISEKFQKKFPVTVLHPNGVLKKYSNFYQFRKEFPIIKFDYIIQHFVNWSRDLIKVKKHKGHRPKIIYHFHSILRREKESGFKTLNRFLLDQEKMIELADTIVCPSRYEYNNFLRYFPDFRDKVVLLENTVDIFPVDEEKVKNLKREHHINDGDIVSLYVGRIELIKGAHILIRYLPYILKKFRKLKFFIVGKSLDANLYRKLRKLLKKFPRQLFYIKYVDKHTLCQYYYLSEIYVNTSLSESFSLSTHEAALCNNALLLTDLPVFEKFKDGALFFSDYKGDGRDFIIKFEHLISSKRYRHMLSQEAENNTKHALSKNNLNQSLDKLIK